MDTIGAAYPNNSSVIRITSEGYDKEVVVDIKDLASVPKAQGTVSLVAGMVEAIQKFGFKVAGFDAYVTTNVIRAAGVSSLTQQSSNSSQDSKVEIEQLREAAKDLLEKLSAFKLEGI